MNGTACSTEPNTWNCIEPLINAMVFIFRTHHLTCQFYQVVPSQGVLLLRLKLEQRLTNS